MNNNRILMVYHCNFLRKNAGNNVYTYNIVESLKDMGFSVDFLAPGFFDDYSDVVELNEKNGKLLDNIYVYRGKQERKEYPYSSFSWVNDGFLKFFQDILEKNSYDYIYIHYVNFLDLIKFSNITPEVKIVVSISDFEALQQFYNSHSIKKFCRVIEEEIELLEYVDEALCISSDELSFFSRFYPQKKFRLLPHFMPSKKLNSGIRDIDCLFIGHSNVYNADAIKWFIDNVYQHLEEGVRVTVCGKVCNMIKEQSPDYYQKMKDHGFNLIDFAPDLDEIYCRTKIAIVPMLAGTGLKIKTVTAMSYGLPVVATPLGVDGFLDKTQNGCLIADDGKTFAQFICKLLTDEIFYKKKAREVSDYFQKHFSQDFSRNVLKKAFSKNENIGSSLRESGDDSKTKSIFDLKNIYKRIFCKRSGDR